MITDSEASPNRLRVLVIDDHYAVVANKESPNFFDRNSFVDALGKLPFDFRFSPAWDNSSRNYTIDAALSAVAKENPAAILLDVMFGRGTDDRLGLEILPELTRRYPAIPVVMMTSLDKDRVWEDCARLGAVDYLPKPLEPRLLRMTLNRYVGAKLSPQDWLIGQDPLFLKALNLAALAAEGGQTPIMITGETGCGKGMFAQFIRRHGKRAPPLAFVHIDLATIPADLQASNLFGHRRGAFSGADRDEPGRFLSADGGIVFLDEIGNIDLGTQERLLRVAGDGWVARLGDGKETHVNVQIVSATNADLPAKIRSKEFRYDLWARLNGMPIALPSLAQRRGDILLLIQHMLRCQALLRSQQVPVLPLKLAAELTGVNWAGNARGVWMYAQRVLDLAGGSQPQLEHYRSAILQATEDVQLGCAMMAVPQAANGVSTVELVQSRTLSDQVQYLRLEELELLHRALMETRHPVTRDLNYAGAAALLKGKSICSSNEFHRWLKAVWKDLTPKTQDVATLRFPELLPAIAKAVKA